MKERNPYDYYQTPINELEHFLEELSKVDTTILPSIKKILDPCAGGDSTIGQLMPYPLCLRKILPNAEIDTNDIREESYSKIKSDYLSSDFKTGKYDMIITNPPFNLALEIMSKAIDDVGENGYVVMLVRVSFLGSQRRKTFWDTNMPKYIFYHHKRMSFVPGGKTDNSEYMHVVFQKGYKENYSKIYVI